MELNRWKRKMFRDFPGKLIHIIVHTEIYIYICKKTKMFLIKFKISNLEKSEAGTHEFLMDKTSSMGFPLTHSVAKEEEAIADPQPNVLKQASLTFPVFSSILI